MWTNNIGEKEEQRRPNSSLQDYYGKGVKFYSARVVDLWNSLDDSTVSVDTITAFKKKLGKLGY